MSNKHKVYKSAIINRKTIRISLDEAIYIVSKTIERLQWLLVKTESSTRVNKSKVVFLVEKSSSNIIIELLQGNNKIITITFAILEIGSGALKYPTTKDTVINRFWRILDHVILSEIREMQ